MRLQLTRPTGEQVFEQLKLAKCDQFIKDYIIGPHSVTGKCELRMVAHVIRMDPRFMEGSLHHLHVDVGPKRLDFRSLKGSIGPGSLQVVVDHDSGRFYADVDAWNPYQDAVNWIGHAFGEVVPAGFRRWFT